MGKSRRKHSREFKIEAVRQVLEGGRSLSEVASGLGITPSVLSRWKAKFESEGAAAFPGNGKVSAADEELRQLRRRLAIAEQERGHLKKSGGVVPRERD